MLANRIYGKRDFKRLSKATALPICLEPRQSNINIAHDDIVVPIAAARKPKLNDKPIAKPRFNAIANNAYLNGVLVSSRAKYRGCKTFCNTKAGKPTP